MEKQTAVEWLIEKWSIQGTLYSSDIFQAKEMERQQIIDAVNLDKRQYDNAEEYYQKTFKSE